MTTLIPKYYEGATGSVNRSINLKLEEFVSIQDFGAIGDGTTDNTAAIQAAFNANDAIYIPEGTYVTKLLQPNLSRFILFGPGKLQLKQGEFSEIILVGSNPTYIHVDGVEFIGNKSNTTATNPALRYRLLNANNSTAFAIVSNCVFHGSNYGGFSMDGKYVTIENNYVYDCGYTTGVGDGISVVSYNPQRVYIQNNTVLNAADYGIAVDAVNAVIQGNYISGALNAGMGSLARGATGSYSNLGINLKFLNNTLINCNNPVEIFSNPTENTSGFIGLEVSGNYINGGTSTNPAITITRNSGGYNPAGSYLYVKDNILIVGATIAQGIGVLGQGPYWETVDVIISGNTMDTSKAIIVSSARDFIISNNVMKTTGGASAIYVSLCEYFHISDNIIDGYDTGITSTKSSGTIEHNDYLNIANYGLKLFGGQYTVNEVFKSIPNRTVWVSVNDESSVFQASVELRGNLAFQDCGASGSPFYIADPTTLGTIYVALESLCNYTSNVVNCPALQSTTNANIRVEAKVAEGCYLSADSVASNIRISSGSPTSGTWIAGTKVHYTAPVSGGYIGSVCTTTGTPGTWKTYGLIS